MEFTKGDVGISFSGNKRITGRFDNNVKQEVNNNKTSLKIVSQTKGSGVDSENAKKNRDDAKVQLRKDKRYESVNLQRRKVN
jgi:hypothetical protein